MVCFFFFLFLLLFFSSYHSCIQVHVETEKIGLIPTASLHLESCILNTVLFTAFVPVVYSLGY